MVPPTPPLRRAFTPTDLLPFVTVPPGEAPVTLESLDISVLVSGLFAESTHTLTLRNPNDRAFEGTLTFPLPEGAVVCGYAIDLDGELVDGTIVAREEARRILETEIRKGVDPGLVEQVRGNMYRTRIYPLPARGTRTVRIVFVSELACDGTSAAHHLPLAHARDIDRVTLRVEIAKGEATPRISGGLGNLSLARLGDGFVAEATLPRGTACDDLLVRLPDLPRHLRAVERSGDETFFAISSAIPAGAAAWEPRRVALLWDASGSRADIETDLALVSALVDAWPGIVFDVRVLRDVVDPEIRTFAGRASRDALLAHLRAAPRDGGTALASFDPAALPHGDDEAWLVLSDGLGTIGRGFAAPGPVSVIACSSAAVRDASYLRHLADRSGGLYVDLLTTPIEAAVRTIATARDALRVVGTEGCADVHVKRGAGRMTLVGRLTADIGQIRLAGAGAPPDHVSVPRSLAAPGRLVARAWAGEQASAMAAADAGDPAILALARRHGVVTANASLLVLESLEQHLEHDVEPAASRKELRAAFVAIRERERSEERATRRDHVERVVSLWEERVRWWETVHEPWDLHAKKRARGPGAAGGELVAAARAEPDFLAMPAMLMSPAPAMMGAPAPMGAAPPPMAMAAPACAPEPHFDDCLAEDAPESGAAPPAPPTASIHIQPWTPDAPYLRALAASPEPYAVYLRERPARANSPSFFLDCGDHLLGRGARALGLRVLSNLVELGLDDPALMRMFAWRLGQAGELDLAVDVLERVRTMRADEPQSHRDLALALADRWEKAGNPADATRAMDLLYDVVERDWPRFPEIELIALMELNRLVAKARERGVEAPSRIDPRLVRLLDLDLRISMSWDLDLTDVDLHVFEPDGEHAYYGHNRTTGGGLVSRDFREGYGPEEYVRRRATPGVYTVKAHYYGSHQQTVAGACTVIVHVTTHFGRPDEERQVLTLRLDRPSSEVVVGDVRFEGGASPPPQAPDFQALFRRLRRGMSIDEIVAIAGHPARIEGTGEMVLVYEPAPGIAIRVTAAPRLVAVRQVMEGAALDLV